MRLPRFGGASSVSSGTQGSVFRGHYVLIARSFTCFDNSAYLGDDRPEKDVYQLLINACRLRMEDT